MNLKMSMNRDGRVNSKGILNKSEPAVKEEHNGVACFVDPETGQKECA